MPGGGTTWACAGSPLRVLYGVSGQNRVISGHFWPKESHFWSFLAKISGIQAKISGIQAKISGIQAKISQKVVKKGPTLYRATNPLTYEVLPGFRVQFSHRI